MIRTGLMVVCVLAVLLSGAVAAPAGDLIVYPAKGQSEEQMDREKYECYSWAKKRTGFDPMAQPKASTPPPQKEARKGGAVRGAAVGAAGGAVVGAITGDVGKGAAIGAGAGAVGGAVRRRRQVRGQAQAEQQWAEQEAGKYTAARSEYNRAYAACLEGKGYTVK